MINLYILFAIFFYTFNCAFPQCKMKLICKKECSHLKIDSTVISLGTPVSYTDSQDNTIEYNLYISSSFDCQPGNKITFTNTANSGLNYEYFGGYMGILTITGDDNQQFEYASDDSNTIFSCNNCNLNKVNTNLEFSGTESTYNILEYTGETQIEITIDIPYEINEFRGTTFDNIISFQTFYFKDDIIPKISGADLSALHARITKIPDSENFILSTTSGLDLNTGSEVGLGEEIKFQRNNEDKFGLIELEYEVKEQVSLGMHSIKFNVCYKYCQTCSRYTSSNPNSKQCLTCKTNCYLIDDSENNIESDRCFSVGEINADYSNYYKDINDNNKYKRCDVSCKTCSSNSYNCNECNKNSFYYFVHGLPDEENTKICYDLDFINGRGNYYLEDSPTGDTFKPCTDNCKTCKWNSDTSSINCFSCVDNYYFYSDKDLNICQSITDSDSNYYLFEDGQIKTYIKRDETCNSINENQNKKKCTECSDNYFKYDNNEDFCYQSQEIYTKFGINNFKDGDIYKKCLDECITCESSANNCLKCKDGYYFQESQTGCKLESDIKALTNPHYYLPKGSDTYYECDSNCICSLEKNNCTGCYNDNKLIEDQNSCTSDTEKEGYYLRDSVFKKCDKSCKKCTEEGPDKCSECAAPYYFIELDNNIKRCITKIEKKENQIYDNYYFNIVSSKFEKCNSQCATCEDGNSGDKCTSCSSGYYFYEGENQECVEINTFINDHVDYYFNTKLEELRKCHESCISCRDGEVYNNCSECNTNYVFIDDPSKGKCVLEVPLSSKLKNYYKLENVNTQLRDGTTISVNVYKKCPDNCEKCRSYENAPLKCLICDNNKGYYKHTDNFESTDHEECYDNYLIEHKYFDGSVYSVSNSQCLLSTYETEKKGSCIKCHNKFGYYSLENAPETCQNIVPVDHYISSDNIIKKCPYECAACSEGPTSDSTNCDVCKEEYSPSLSNPKNCILKCDYYIYIYYGNKYCTGEKECPDLAPFLYKENSTCVTKCEKVAYYGICLDECPSNTYESNKECKDYANTCTLTKFEEIREHLVDLKKDNDPVIKKVKKYKKYFSYTSYHIDIYTHYLNEYIMLIYQKSDCINQLLPNIISVDFTPCFYPENNYISVLFLVPRDNKYSKIYYQLYEIDASNPIQITSITQTCSEQIKVQIPASQAKFGYDKYQRLYNKGIRLDNYLENFFYDMCFQNYEDGKDIIIKQRRREYYQDPCKICLDNCTFSRPPNNYERALCQCSYKNNYLDELYQEYEDTNKYCVMNEEFYKTDGYIFEHFKCFKYNFEKGNLFENMGNYMMIVFIVLEIISVVIYLVFGIDSIKLYIIDFIKGNPPKKNKLTTGSEDELNKESNNIDIKSISKNNSSSNKKYKKKSQIISNNFVEKNQRTLNNNNKIKRWEEPELLIGRSNNLGNSEFKNKDIKIYERYTKKETILQKDINGDLKEDIENKNNSVLFKSTIKLKNQSDNKNPEFKKHSHVFTDYELNSMELYDALIKDKRDFCYFYKLQMKSKQEFYRAFCINEPLYPMSIKIFIYIFNLSLNLSFNALLYTEKQIYEGVKSIGKNIGNIFLRAFYTFLIIKVIDYFVNLFIKNSNYLRSLVLRRKREKELRIEAYKSLKNIKNNFCCFIVFVFICDVLFWIFLVSYCYSYNGEQLELFGAFLVTQFYMEIYCILFGLYLAVFRLIGMKCKATTCYKLSQTFLDT